MLEKIPLIPNRPLLIILLYDVVCYEDPHPRFYLYSSRRPPTHRGTHKGVEPAGQSPIPLCCKMSSNERVIVTPSVLGILEHGTMCWCKGFEIPLPQGYQARVSNGVVQFTGSRGTMTCHRRTGAGSHRQFPSLRHHLPL